MIFQEVLLCYMILSWNHFSQCREPEARVVNHTPKWPESQQEKWIEPDFQLISGLCIWSQSTPSKRSQGILTMPNVFNSEWSPIITLKVVTWDMEPFDRGLPSKPQIGTTGLRGVEVSWCLKMNSSDTSEDCEPLSIIVHAKNRFLFGVCTVALHSKWSSATNVSTKAVSTSE